MDARLKVGGIRKFRYLVRMAGLGIFTWGRGLVISLTHTDDLLQTDGVSS